MWISHYYYGCRGNKSFGGRWHYGMMAMTILCLLSLSIARAEIEEDVLLSHERILQEEEDDMILSSNNNNNNNNNSNNERCPFGTPGCTATSYLNNENTTSGSKIMVDTTIPFIKSNNGNDHVNPSSSSSSSSSSHGGESSSTSTSMVEVDDSTVVHHEPPEGFQIAAHIVTGEGGLSYFATADHLVVPFMECGAIGSTTQPLALKHATFRHFPHGAEPSEWSTVQSPTLVIPLSPVELKLSGGQSRTFPAGSVLLLEDTLGQGHKLISAKTPPNCNTHNHKSHPDLMAVMLSLPTTYHHYNYQVKTSNEDESKYRVTRLFHLARKKAAFVNQPCTDPNFANQRQKQRRIAFSNQLSVSVPRLILTTVGITFSSSLAYFLSKVAPLQLAVGVGGACIIGGGTACIVKGGELMMDQAYTWLENKRFSQESSTTTNTEEEEEEDNDDDDETYNDNDLDLDNSNDIKE